MKTIRVIVNRKIGKPYKVVEGLYAESDRSILMGHNRSRWHTLYQHSEHNTREEAEQAKKELEDRQQA